MNSTLEPQMETRIERERKQPRLVTFGRGGFSVYFGRHKDGELSYSQSVLSGYDDPQDFFQARKWWAHDYKTIRDSAQYEGVPFIDMREAVESGDGYSWAIKGPMVNVDLEPETCSPCPQPDALMVAGIAGNPDPTFATLLVLNAATRATGRGCLDSVSIPEFVAGWKAHGATVGTIQDGKFIAV